MSSSVNLIQATHKMLIDVAIKNIIIFLLYATVYKLYTKS